MSIGAELLNPIPGPNPAGASLRYDPTYDKIKEARREDDSATPQGEWAHELKKSDWPLVIKLCSDLLSNKTKDLQLAAWLTEALLRREGLLGLQQGLELCRGLVDQYWDSLYPEAEGGDYEERAAHLDWIGVRLGDRIGQVSLTKSGLNLFQYKESRAVGSEADVANSDSKREAREQAIADRKLTAEEFDKAVGATSKAFYQQRLDETNGCMEAIIVLSQACDAKFGAFAPSFSRLRDALETLRQTVSILLAKKRETEPDEEAYPSVQEAEQLPPEQSEQVPLAAVSQSGAAAAPARAPKKESFAAEPVDREDAYRQMAMLAAWLRKENPRNPAPYIIVRAMRWAELRAGGDDIDPNLLEPPSTQLRTEIKRLFLEGNYDELFPLMEAAAAQPCGRGWLDLQRYFCNACDTAGGYDNVKNAVVAELKALLGDYTDLPKMTLLDDTPTANPETLAWLQPLLQRETETLLSEAPLPYPMPPLGKEPPVMSQATGETTALDAFEMAMQAASHGRKGEAIGLIAREVAMESCGRSRFMRQLQLAQVCLSTGHEIVAYPILEGLAEEIETRKLEGWEQPELLAQVLSLLFQCAGKLTENPEYKHKLYARICRLDPMRALDLKQ